MIIVTVNYCPVLQLDVPPSHMELWDVFVPLAAQSSQQTHTGKQSVNQPYYHPHFPERWGSLEKRAFHSIVLLSWVIVNNSKLCNLKPEQKSHNLTKSGVMIKLLWDSQWNIFQVVSDRTLSTFSFSFRLQKAKKPQCICSRGKMMTLVV